MKLLKNNGTPYVKTISVGRQNTYFTKATKGKFKECLVTVGVHRPEAVDPELEEFNIKKNEKIFLYSKREQAKGEWVVDRSRGDNGIKIAKISDSFTVTHYPHIVGVKIGTSKYDEREYNVLSGQVLEVEDADADILFKQFGSLDEVDDKGEVIVQNRWQRDKKEYDDKKKISSSELAIKVPKKFEEVDWNDNRFRQTPIEKTQPNLEEDSSMKKNEKGDKEI